MMLIYTQTIFRKILWYILFFSACPFYSYGKDINMVESFSHVPVSKQRVFSPHSTYCDELKCTLDIETETLTFLVDFVLFDLKGSTIDHDFNYEFLQVFPEGTTIQILDWKFFKLEMSFDQKSTYEVWAKVKVLKTDLSPVPTGWVSLLKNTHDKLYLENSTTHPVIIPWAPSPDDRQNGWEQD